MAESESPKTVFEYVSRSKKDPPHMMVLMKCHQISPLGVMATALTSSLWPSNTCQICYLVP